MCKEAMNRIAKGTVQKSERDTLRALVYGMCKAAMNHIAKGTVCRNHLFSFYIQHRKKKDYVQRHEQNIQAILYESKFQGVISVDHRALSSLTNNQGLDHAAYLI